MKTWITLFNTLTVLSVLSASVKCMKSVSISDSDLDPGKIYVVTDVDAQGGLVEMMSNISYTCVIKFDCNKPPNACILSLPPAQRIQWLTPRELVEHQLIYGKDSGRVKFSQTTYYLQNNSRYFMVKGKMSIRDVGAIHGGNYSCYHENSRTNLNFKINVRGRDARGQCNYADQCLSENCIQHKCMCDINQVYDSSSEVCLKVADYGELCTDDLQCTFKLGNNASECLNGRCDCKEGSILVNRGSNIRMCFKIVQLNQMCIDSSQCTKNEVHSYCALGNRCKCKTGYQLIDNKCKPFKECNSTKIVDNHDFTRAGCDKNQFCTNNVCLCQPNYQFDGNGTCNKLVDEKLETPTPL